MSKGIFFVNAELDLKLFHVEFNKLKNHRKKDINLTSRLKDDFFKDKFYKFWHLQILGEKYTEQLPQTLIFQSGCKHIGCRKLEFDAQFLCKLYFHKKLVLESL